MTWAEATGERYSIPDSRVPSIASGAQRAAGATGDAGAHQAQGLGDAAHRPPAQVAIAAEHREERVRGEQAGHQAHPGAGVAEVEHALGLAPTAEAGSPNGERLGVPRGEGDAEAAQRQGGVLHVPPCGRVR